MWRLGREGGSVTVVEAFVMLQRRLIARLSSAMISMLPNWDQVRYVNGTRKQTGLGGEVHREGEENDSSRETDCISRWQHIRREWKKAERTLTPMPVRLVSLPPEHVMERAEHEVEVPYGCD